MKQNIIDHQGYRPIRDLINDLIDKEVMGYTEVRLIADTEPYELEGREGEVDYESIPKLEFS